MSNKNLTIGLAIISVIAIAGLFFPSQVSQYVQQQFGGVTNYDEVDATAMKIGGSSGTRVGPVIIGNCALIGTDGSQAASSTLPYDCAVTGVVSGDFVQAQIATTTVFKVSTGWAISGGGASTTAGYITVLLSNNTGAAATPSVTGVGSTTAYEIMHPRSSVPGL